MDLKFLLPSWVSFSHHFKNWKNFIYWNSEMMKISVFIFWTLRSVKN
jgi:hypothetical protein